MKLIVVESPNKVKSIQHYLDDVSGPGVWRVAASAGHIRDLPMRKETPLSAVIDTQTWTETYVVDDGKRATVETLRRLAQSASAVVLATDPDREGEAIAWHLAEVLRLKEPTRVTFNEITKTGIAAAIKAPRPLDRHLVSAQRARRITDYILGFELSPRLWPFHLKSAGRVQSAALRILVERERAIAAFQQRPFFTIEATYAEGFTAAIASFQAPTEDEVLDADNDPEAAKPRLKPIRFQTETEADALLRALSGATHIVEAVESTPVSQKPKAPFTTAALLGEASRVLSFKPAKTTDLAQALFEKGLVTYIRTDSTSLSDEAVTSIRAFISQHHPRALPPEPNRFNDKASAQGAHEAIRPTSMEALPQKQQALTDDERALYALIWERTLLCQCAPLRGTKTTITIRPGSLKERFIATGTVVTDEGHKAVARALVQRAAVEAGDKRSKDEGHADPRLPPLSKGARVQVASIAKKAGKTTPPSRFNVRTFINYLEARGIGRPSTLKTLFSTLEQREYIAEKKKFLVPTEQGMLCTDLLVMGWPQVTDERYTATIESTFDKVAEGSVDRRKLLSTWYAHFQQLTSAADQRLKTFAEKNPLAAGGSENHDAPCPKCGAAVVKKKGPYGLYLACTACAFRENLAEKVFLKDPCPQCEAKSVLKQEYMKDGKRASFYRCDACSWKSSFAPPKVTKARCHIDPSHGFMREVSWAKDGRKGSFFQCPTCQFRADTLEPAPTCPSCQTPHMRRRESPRGAFWSCRTWPDCKATLDAAPAPEKRARARPGRPT